MCLTVLVFDLFVAVHFLLSVEMAIPAFVFDEPPFLQFYIFLQLIALCLPNTFTAF
jgi:hypothetical protein